MSDITTADLNSPSRPFILRCPAMKVFVIIPAAGLGTRMASFSAGTKSKSKQFFELNGTPILIHTVRKFAAKDSAQSGEVKQVSLTGAHD